MYQTLEFEDSVRLLELLPSSAAPDELRFRLKVARLSEDVQFEALSYTWGAPAFSHKLYNVDTREYVGCTDNLFAALWELRRSNDIRI